MCKLATESSTLYSNRLTSQHFHINTQAAISLFSLKQRLCSIFYLTVPFLCQILSESCKSEQFLVKPSQKRGCLGAASSVYSTEARPTRRNQTHIYQNILKRAQERFKNFHQKQKLKKFHLLLRICEW